METLPNCGQSIFWRHILVSRMICAIRTQDTNAVWESEEEMLASEAGAGYLQAKVAKFDMVFANPPIFNHYELSAEASV